MAYTISLDMAGRESSVLAPLDCVPLKGNAPEGGNVALTDGAGRLYAAARVEGDFEGEIMVGGALGHHRATLVDRDSRPLAEVSFRVDARTKIESDTGGYGKMWLQMESMVRRTRTMYVLHGEPMTFYVPWVRDNVHVMKAFKYWEPEIASLPEHFLKLQRPDGMIFDYIRPAGFAAERMEVFGPRYYWVDEEEDFRYDRLPDEADVEYLLIEGIYTSWQATGDDAWMARQLPAWRRPSST